MDVQRLKALAMRFGPAALVGLLIGIALMWLLGSSGTGEEQSTDPRRVVDAALVSVREQGRMSVLSARYVAVVSSAESHLGLEARKTLILPGEVRYGIDLRALRREHLTWEEATRTLTIRLPPLEISVPDIDMAGAREFREGGVLMALTGTEQELDQANLRLAQRELLRQARRPKVLQTARDSAMRTVARAFALPLRAAGIEASVSARFVDPEGRDEAVHLDRDLRVEDAVDNRQAGERVPPPEAEPPPPAEDEGNIE
ncbi:DUF4230 domain-containing protein [Allosphingosinicella sp.]|jgi:hypothetical protein|uniref:DUF4230 domain-containing protein n=1 Tax=Allosphingosinicella sp. TaxID=2823234 RepID=UPI002F00B567